MAQQQQRSYDDAGYSLLGVPATASASASAATTTAVAPDVFDLGVLPEYGGGGTGAPDASVGTSVAAVDGHGGVGDDDGETRSVVDITATRPQHVLWSRHMVPERTLSVFGAPCNGDAAEFARALFGADYAAPRGVHCAQYVSFHVRLTNDNPVWSVNEASLQGTPHALQHALEGAVATSQPSLDMTADARNANPAYIGSEQLENHEFDVENAIMLAACVERAAHRAGDVDVGVRVGLYTDAHARGDARASGRAPTQREVLQCFNTFAVGTSAGGSKYSFVVHAHEPPVVGAPIPRRIGQPAYTAWTDVFENTTASYDETELWDIVHAGNTVARLVFVKCAAPIAAGSAPNATSSSASAATASVLGDADASSAFLPENVFAANARLNTCLVHLTSQSATQSRSQLGVAFAGNVVALQNAYMRLKIYERKAAATSDDTQAAARRARIAAHVELCRAHPNTTFWLVMPDNAQDSARWKDNQRFPLALDDEIVGVRTITAVEERILSTVRVTVGVDHVAYKIVLNSDPDSPPDGNGARVVSFTNYVRVVNAHLADMDKHHVSRQMHDVSRLTVSAHALGVKTKASAKAKANALANVDANEEGKFDVSLTVGFVLAPLALASGPDYVHIDATEHTAQMATFLDGHVYTMPSGMRRAVIPLRQNDVYIRPMAFDRARARARTSAPATHT